MDFLDTDHLAAMSAVAGLALALTLTARAHPGDWLKVLSRALAIAILVAFVGDHIAAVIEGSWSLRRYLPLHLTDAVILVAVAALWTARPLLIELTYLWGLTGALQATLTPNLGDGFPSVFYFTYFLTHGGVVVAAVFLVWGRRFDLRPGAVGRAFAATAALAVLAAVGNLATGGNYMFLRRKPSSASLLDVMGPWPLYILSAALLALAMFYALDTPWRRGREQGRGSHEKA